MPMFLKTEKKKRNLPTQKSGEIMKNAKFYFVPVLMLTVILTFSSCSQKEEAPEVAKTPAFDSITYNFEKWQNTKQAVRTLYQTLSAEVDSNPNLAQISGDSLKLLVHNEVKSKGFASMEEFLKLETEILGNNKYDSILFANNVRGIN